MAKQKPVDPRNRIGVYKRLADVPDRYRLENQAAEYEGRDVWSEFIEYERETVGYDSDRYIQNSERCERYWKEHMEDRGRHHALATPTDVETFISGLLDRMESRTAYQPYWVRLESFYDHLQWRVDHPHRYHPVVMAATVPESAARRVWEEKLDRYGSREINE
ncbi:hypothetical protein [Natrinema sp. SYSU A 869]|uniref:hypothetical protein n=1 Tax=Natrinema sp. SYSU A 869 TaxID=2871694 RepID=UPI001CA44C58|nr:hypothetical protein [Natrinema sp. SYSU A 869]